MFHYCKPIFSDQTLETLPWILSLCPAIDREEGSNGDREMAAAVWSAGMRPWDVTMSDLLQDRASLQKFKGETLLSTCNRLAPAGPHICINCRFAADMHLFVSLAVLCQLSHLMGQSISNTGRIITLSQHDLHGIGTATPQSLKATGMSGRCDFLTQVAGIVFVGGFSYADVLDSAKGWAGTIRHNQGLQKQFTDFYLR